LTNNVSSTIVMSVLVTNKKKKTAINDKRIYTRGFRIAII